MILSAYKIFLRSYFMQHNSELKKKKQEKTQAVLDEINGRQIKEISREDKNLFCQGIV